MGDEVSCSTVLGMHKSIDNGIRAITQPSSWRKDVDVEGAQKSHR